MRKTGRNYMVEYDSVGNKLLLVPQLKYETRIDQEIESYKNIHLVRDRNHGNESVNCLV